MGRRREGEGHTCEFFLASPALHVIIFFSAPFSESLASYLLQCSKIKLVFLHSQGPEASTLPSPTREINLHTAARVALKYKLPTENPLVTVHCSYCKASLPTGIYEPSITCLLPTPQPPHRHLAPSLLPVATPAFSSFPG